MDIKSLSDVAIKPKSVIDWKYRRVVGYIIRKSDDITENVRCWIEVVRISDNNVFMYMKKIKKERNNMLTIRLNIGDIVYNKSNEK